MDDYVVGVKKEDKERIHSADHNEKVDYSTPKKFLQNTHVSSLAPDSFKVYSVTSDAPLLEAFQIIVDNKILSLPVLDTRKNMYVAFIDILDILTNSIKDLRNPDPVNLEKLLKKNAIFEGVTVSSIIGASDRNPFFSFDQKAPLKVAIDTMVSKKLHRFAVVDGANKVVTVVTQSQILKLINKNIGIFKVASHKTIGELNLGIRKVEKVLDSQIVVDAFKTIIDKKVSGLAVVDAQGNLIGDVTATDLQRIKSDSLHKFWLSVNEYLDLSHSTGPACVVSTTTVEELVKKIIESKLHRVYIVNDKKEPIGVISLIDLIEYFSHAE